MMAAILLTATSAMAASDGEKFKQKIENTVRPSPLCYCIDASGVKRVGVIIPSYSAIGGGGNLFVYVTCGIPRFQWLPDNTIGDEVGNEFEVQCGNFERLTK